MLTLRLKPKTIFGIILIVTGVVVIMVTFLSNHIDNKSTNVMSAITLETDEQREEYLKSFGWEFNTNFTEKEVKIPAEFNETYKKYNEIQKSQGFDLSKYKGETVKVYTYNLTNYTGYENRDCIFANLLVYDNTLIGADVCSTSVSDGFMQALKKQ